MYTVLVVVEKVLLLPIHNVLYTLANKKENLGNSFSLEFHYSLLSSSILFFVVVANTKLYCK